MTDEELTAIERRLVIDQANDSDVLARQARIGGRALIAALVEAEADRDRARDAAVEMEQQLAEIKKITDQIESAAASDVRIRDERIEAAIERDGVWSSSRNPEIARASMAIDIQTGIVKRLRRALDGGER